MLILLHSTVVISTHFKMITVSLVTICRFTKNIVIDYIPHIERFTPTTLLFCNWKFVTLNLPHLFLSSLHPYSTIFNEHFLCIWHRINE